MLASETAAGDVALWRACPVRKGLFKKPRETRNIWTSPVWPKHFFFQILAAKLAALAKKLLPQAIKFSEVGKSGWVELRQHGYPERLTQLFSSVHQCSFLRGQDRGEGFFLLKHIMKGRVDSGDWLQSLRYLESTVKCSPECRSVEIWSRRRIEWVFWTPTKAWLNEPPDLPVSMSAQRSGLGLNVSGWLFLGLSLPSCFCRSGSDFGCHSEVAAKPPMWVHHPWGLDVQTALCIHHPTLHKPHPG